MQFLFDQIRKRFLILFETSWTLVSQIVLTLLNTLLVFMLANILIPSDFGQFKFITTWGAIAYGLGYTGYTYIITQKIAKNEIVYLGVLYKKTIIRSWYIFVLLLLISGYYFLQNNILLSLGFLLTVFTTITTLLSPLASGFYIGKRKIIFNSNVLVAISSFQILFVYIVSFFSSNIFFILISFLLTTSIAQSLNIFYAFRKSKSELGTIQISSAEIKFEEDSANKLNLTSIISTFIYHSDKLLLFHFVGAAQLAIYSIVIAISDQLRTPFKNFSSVVLPRLATTQNPKIKTLYTFYIVTFISVALAIVFYFLNPYIFLYLFPKYIDYVYISNLSLFGLLFSGASIIAAFIQSKKEYGILNTYSIITIIFTILLFPVAAYFKSIELFVIFRNVILFLSFTYLMYKFFKLEN